MAAVPSCQGRPCLAEGIDAESPVETALAGPGDGQRPGAVDPAHPFPYISNLALSLAAMISDPDTGERRFARVKVPNVFPRLVALPDGKRFVPVEQIIAAQMHKAASSMPQAQSRSATIA